MTIPTKAEAWAVRARELMILSAKELEDAHHDIEKLKDSLSKEVTESERLRAELDALREFVEDVAGFDCDQYDKYLNPVPCGNCLSCRARAALAAQEKP